MSSGLGKRMRSSVEWEEGRGDFCEEEQTPKSLKGDYVVDVKRGEVILAGDSVSLRYFE